MYYQFKNKRPQRFLKINLVTVIQEINNLFEAYFSAQMVNTSTSSFFVDWIWLVRKSQNAEATSNLGYCQGKESLCARVCQVSAKVQDTYTDCDSASVMPSH